MRKKCDAQAVRLAQPPSIALSELAGESENVPQSLIFSLAPSAIMERFCAVLLKPRS